jgi:hypothetical protein
LGPAVVRFDVKFLKKSGEKNYNDVGLQENRQIVLQKIGEIA